MPKKIRAFTFLFLAIPLTFVAQWCKWPSAWVMALASLGIVPIARLMGEATEHISHRVGPTVGGLVNATFGNACELIIAIIALKAGLIEVVKASITGSIIGNILLVLGGSMLIGGLKYEEQEFNRVTAGTAATFLTVMAFSLMMPAALHYAAGQESQAKATTLALFISMVLMLLYFLGLLFALKTHKHLFDPVVTTPDEQDDITAKWSLKKSTIVLLICTLAVVGLSEVLVDNVEAAARSFGMTPVFVGVILLAIVGNAAENSTAILMARKNKMDLSMNIVLGSSTQIAMFVAPVVVIAGFFMGKPMDLVFSQAEILAVFASVVVLSLVVQDGKSNWLEGANLLGLYAIIAISFYFLR